MTKRGMTKPWDGKAPGLEKALSVLRPVAETGTPAVYVRLHRFTRGLEFLRAAGIRWGVLVCEIATKGIMGRPALTPGLMIYRNERADERVFAAKRVERAIENDDFLQICASECLAADFDGECWQVNRKINPLPAYSGISKTLRGAYLDYHATASVHDPLYADSLKGVVTGLMATEAPVNLWERMLGYVDLGTALEKVAMPAWHGPTTTEAPAAECAFGVTKLVNSGVRPMPLAQPDTVIRTAGGSMHPVDLRVVNGDPDDYAAMNQAIIETVNRVAAERGLALRSNDGS